MHEGLQGNDEARVDQGQDTRQRAVDQGAVDNDINIPQPVAQHGDTECDWDPQH